MGQPFFYVARCFGNLQHPCQMFNSVHPCTLLNDEICAMHKSRCCLCTQPSLAGFCFAKRTSSLLTQTSTVLTRRSAGEKPYRVFRMKNSKVINVQGCTLMTRRPCRHRQGWRADKATTSFTKIIFLWNSQGNWQQGCCQLPSFWVSGLSVKQKCVPSQRAQNYKAI